MARSVRVRLGEVWKDPVWWGVARLGPACQGLMWQGSVGLGMAGFGRAWLGMARLGALWRASARKPSNGWVWQGVFWAWLGEAGHGET
jgi:hypothetical protein